jgi:hypothetical protein
MPGTAERRLPVSQARLLERINRGFSDSWWQRYDRLVGKRERDVLTPAEHRELIRLTDVMERREAKRLQALIKLARLRKKSLRDLIEDLGLPSRSDG